MLCETSDRHLRRNAPTTLPSASLGNRGGERWQLVPLPLDPPRMSKDLGISLVPATQRNRCKRNALERAKGFEPSTSTLGRLRSTN